MGGAKDGCVRSVGCLKERTCFGACSNRALRTRRMLPWRDLLNKNLRCDHGNHKMMNRNTSQSQYISCRGMSEQSRSVESWQRSHLLRHQP
eukprot:01535_6